MVQTYDGFRAEKHVSKVLTGGTTYISGNTADDYLPLAGDLDGSAEISVVPGVDLTTPADDGNVWIHLGDLREERTVGALNARRNRH